jgi:peroxiredoxin
VKIGGVTFFRMLYLDLIDKDGVVRKVWDKVKPEGHAEEVLQAVDALNS